MGLVTSLKRKRWLSNQGMYRKCTYLIGILGFVCVMYAFKNCNGVLDQGVRISIERVQHSDDSSLSDTDTTGRIKRNSYIPDKVNENDVGAKLRKLGLQEAEEQKLGELTNPDGEHRQQIYLNQKNLNLETNFNEISTDTYKFVIDKKALYDMFRYERKVKEINCQLVFERDNRAIVDSVMDMVSGKKKHKVIDNSYYTQLANNCTEFLTKRGYFQSSFTKIEEDFPLAYSIVVFKDVEQIERLLRAVYRPHNYYCIHVDAKTGTSDRQTLASIASCFPNVFLSSRSFDVEWGQMTVLDAELICMRDLLRYKSWRYFINLTGQEFPLKTNLEIVTILTAMKGANLVDATWVRARQNYIYRWTKSGKMPPHKIRPTKGSVHIAVNRHFVEFAINDPKSRDFLDWLNSTEIPDETFFSSLNHNPHLGIPGSFLGEAEEYPMKPTITRYKNWEIGHGVWARTCSGKYVHNICVLGIGDLHRLVNDVSLFANKFYMDYQYLAYDCLEELIYNKTRDQYLKREPIDVAFYQSLDQVRLRLT